MASVSDWQKAAEKKQTQTEQDYLKKNQYVLDALNQQRDAALNELNAQRQSAIDQLNKNKETASETAATDARQANINRLLSLRDNQSALNRAGLGTQGIVGSQVNSINNSYGRNLNDILNRKADELQNIDSQIGDTNLQFDTNISNTNAQYDSNLANTRAQLEEQARQAGLQAYQNYYNAQQAAWEKEMQEKQYRESVRQYNTNLALQQKQFSETQKAQQIKTNYYSGDINPDTKYGTFKTKDKNGVYYQPDNIGGVKVKSTGKKAKDLYGSNATNSSGVNIANQTVWECNGKYYVWNGSKNKYEQVAKK